MKAPTIERRRLVVTGVVQGVGFRPFVHRLATRLHLSGTVTNSSARVVIEVAGLPELLDRFQQLLVDEAPPLASIESLIADRLEAGSAPLGGFTIVESEADGADPSQSRIFVAPDTAPCQACRAEMLDPSNRRFRHPFISCTDCGPRFTIIESLPYDRPSTTMAGFEMCPACHAEYHDPSDRRFHAQPIACHDCGPTLLFRTVHLRRRSVSPEMHRTGDAAVGAASELVVDGGVVVVRGVGGFQLACDAGNEQAVAGLRAWKNRPDKPLAILVADLAGARRLVELNAAEEELLTSPARPIVLARRRVHGGVVDGEVFDGAVVEGAVVDGEVCDGVAPTQPRLGVMLPPSPVHELLVATVGRPLVLTSGNHSGAPMAYRDDQLPDLLAGSDDLDVPIGLLTHDRPIAVPCDDSVLRVGAEGPTFIRRARGFAPTAVDVGPPGPSLLAVGGQLKNTFCLLGPTQGWVSQHVGDMDDFDTVHAFGDSVDRFEQFYAAEPQAVVVDAHPDHGPRAWARRNRPGHPVIEVQHHHAHVASVLAEHGVGFDDPVIGVAFDGTGYGLDRNGAPAVWGGEFLAVTGGRYRRIAHLKPVPMPGGDAAVINPYRVALVHLLHGGIDAHDLPPAHEADDSERSVLARQLRTGFGCLPNSSMGRLFDAVSSIVGLRHRISYEAQGAIELELAATRAATAAKREDGTGPGRIPGYQFAIERYDHDGAAVLQADVGPVLGAIVADVRAGRQPEPIALGFHRAVVDLIVEVCRAHADTLNIHTVALSGGVFQNALLAGETAGALRAAGFRVLTNRLVPPNDGGLALGQAYVGRHHLLLSRVDDAQGGPSCA